MSKLPESITKFAGEETKMMMDKISALSPKLANFAVHNAAVYTETCLDQKMLTAVSIAFAASLGHDGMPELKRKLRGALKHELLTVEQLVDILMILCVDHGFPTGLHACLALKEIVDELATNQ